MKIVELDPIRLLVAHGVIVICAGGGGIPVVPRPGGGYAGVEAVIDKDAVSALLATALGADALVLLTDVDGVYRGWGTDSPELIGETTVDELRALGAPAGSMGPKVEAACAFIAAGGRYAAIGSLEAASDVAAGRAGTRLSA